MDAQKNARKLSRRDFVKGAAFAGAGLVVAACTPPQPAAPAAGAATQAPTTAPSSGGKVSIRFVTNHGSSDVPLFQKVIENFKAKAPDITIEHLDLAGNEFYDSINSQGAAKALPDVWYTRTFDVPVYASKGWTISMEDLVQKDSAEVNVDDFWPAEVAQMRYQGKLYALPYDFSNIGIYYNKTAFDKDSVPLPPESWKWEDLANLATKFVKQDSKGKYSAWGLIMYTWNWVFMGLLYGWGGKVFSDDLSTCVINSKENVDCFKWFVDQRNKGLYPEAGSMPEGVDPFAAGLAPMAFQGSWATTFMRDTIKDKFEFDCTAMPLSPTGKSCINAAGGAWGIAANSKNVDAAWTWTKFLTSTESTDVLISDPLRSIPGRKSSAKKWDAVAAQGGLPPKNVTVFSKQMETANAAPYPSYWQAFGNAWSNMIDPLLNGTSKDEPEAVLAQFQDEVNRQAKKQS